MDGSAKFLVCASCKHEYLNEQDLMQGTSRWRKSADGMLWFDCSCGKALSLKEGQHEFFSPANSMSERAKSIFAQLKRRKEIPHLPAAALRLQQIVNDPDADPAAIAAAVRQDPLLAAQLLAQANNLKAQTGEKIKSFEHAIVFVGRRTLSELLLVASLSAFQLPTRVFRAAAFWREAFLAAYIGEMLARTQGRDVSPDEAYLAAALCNIGKLIAAICQPDLTDMIAERVTKEHGESWRKAEAGLMAPDHAVLGEIGVVLWGLPPYIADTCARHHALPKMGLDDPRLDLAEIVALSNQLMHMVLHQSFTLEPDIMKPLLVRIGYDQKKLKIFHAQCRRHFEEIGQVPGV